MTENEIGKVIVNCALTVHKNLGPGLLENTYQACLLYELNESGLAVHDQAVLPVNYKGVSLDVGYRIDLW